MSSVRPRGADDPGNKPRGMKERKPHPNSTSTGRKLRMSVVWRDKGLCRWCGQVAQQPEMHHIDGNRDNNEDENLALLCHSCHLEVHYGCWQDKPRSLPPRPDHQQDSSNTTTPPLFGG